jgi:hypothetical protein
LECKGMKLCDCVFNHHYIRLHKEKIAKISLYRFYVGVNIWTRNIICLQSNHLHNEPIQG